MSLSRNDTASSGSVTFGWCFDHGRLHRFAENLDEVGKSKQCSAAWVPLVGSTEEEALEYKQLAWGPAQFFHQLTLDRQGGLIGILEKRRNQSGAHFS
ncbi:hypothetical protein ACFW2V_13125 [Streptomyces sp. NPDC058947]|uniref:hypothetical protein n=1 Tax=Streptomyces sp. NPDC058947 TaxID=3346675 RepID=UPI0036CCDD92